MSAAAPLPPPHLSNGNDEPGSNSGSGHGKQPYAHLQDLVEHAERRVDPVTPVSH